MRLEGLQGCAGGGWGQREEEEEEEDLRGPGRKKNLTCNKITELHRKTNQALKGTSQAGEHAVMFSTIRRTFVRVQFFFLLVEMSSVHLIILRVLVG